MCLLLGVLSSGNVDNVIPDFVSDKFKCDSIPSHLVQMVHRRVSLLIVHDARMYTGHGLPTHAFQGRVYHSNHVIVNGGHSSQIQQDHICWQRSAPKGSLQLRENAETVRGWHSIQSNDPFFLYAFSGDIVRDA